MCACWSQVRAGPVYTASSCIATTIPRVHRLHGQHRLITPHLAGAARRSGRLGPGTSSRVRWSRSACSQSSRLAGSSPRTRPRDATSTTTPRLARLLGTLRPRNQRCRTARNRWQRSWSGRGLAYTSATTVYDISVVARRACMEKCVRVTTAGYLLAAVRELRAPRLLPLPARGGETGSV